MAKVLISMEEGLLRRVDRAARALHLTRSAYIAGLARNELDARSGAGASPEARAALRRIEGLVAKNGTPGEDSTRIVRETRDTR
ncbi:MAG TPA: hypothetical protein VFF07_16620 [Actinomycetota bacterium]|nr:hypothetical protein [Actinomycetota bacterium]